MKNFVYVSPNYPENHWLFARGLKKHGARVLGIIDTSYDSLMPELKENLDDVYVVSNFNDYDQVYKALAHFASKYGKIDWVESNNEAWLAHDARLREDFNIKTGFHPDQIEEFQSKSAMKKYYEKAGVPVAPYALPKTFVEALRFAREAGYPLVLKPDHGVGASYTWKINNDQELEAFWNEAKALKADMILEKYVDGEVMTLDGIADADGNINFLCSMGYVSNCMESVQNHDSIGSYYNFDVSDEERKLAQKVVNAFDIKNRFFHGEYFKLKEDVKGLGKKGELIGLEMNFRPPGGFCPDLINYSYDMDIYDLWADVLMNGTKNVSQRAPYSAGFTGRRKDIDYKLSLDELLSKYKDNLLGVQYLPEAFANTMGDITIQTRFDNEEARQQFFNDSFERKDNA